MCLSEVELPLYHELHGTINIQINEAVAKIARFITRQNNPYLLQNSPTLTWFTTGLSFPLDNARQILFFLDTELKGIKCLVVVVYIFRYFRLYLQKSIEKIKKREEAEPQGQALAKRTCRGGRNEQTKKKCY